MDEETSVPVFHVVIYRPLFVFIFVFCFIFYFLCFIFLYFFCIHFCVSLVLFLTNRIVKYCIVPCTLCVDLYVIIYRTVSYIYIGVQTQIVNMHIFIKSSYILIIAVKQLIKKQNWNDFVTPMTSLIKIIKNILLMPVSLITCIPLTSVGIRST